MRLKFLKIGLVTLITILLLICILFLNFSRLLLPIGHGNHIVDRWAHFYKQQKNSIDILIVGSSHAYGSFNEEMLEKATNKEVFILGSNSQISTYSYFCIREALKTQSPELIVFETFSLSTQEYAEDHLEAISERWKCLHIIDGMKFSKNKYDFINAVCNENEKVNALFPFIPYFQNIYDKNIIESNYERFYKKDSVKYNGHTPAPTVMTEQTAKEFDEFSFSYDSFKIPSEQVEYVNKISTLCKEKEIPLILVKAPMYDKFIKKSNYEKRYNAVKKIADDNNLVYIDYNIGENKLDLSKECFEDYVSDYIHLNSTGANIMTYDFIKKITNMHL